MRIVMESEGFWVNMSFPSSTMDIRCPLPRAGYRIIVSFIFMKMENGNESFQLLAR